MAVIGNTYVGYNPSDAAFNQTVQTAGQNMGESFRQAKTRDQERKAADAKELDDTLKAQFAKFGPFMFQDTYLDKDGNSVPNPFAEQARTLLQESAKSHRLATGGDEKAYISQFFDTPFSPEQMDAWAYTTGAFLKSQTQLPEPPVTTPAQPPVAASAQPPVAGPMENPSTGPTKPPLVVPARSREVDPTPVPMGTTQEENDFYNYLAELKRVSQIGEPSARAGMLRQLELQHPDWYRSLTNPVSSELPHTSTAPLTPEAQAQLQGAIQRQDVDRIKDYVDQGAKIKARGSGQPEMTPEELAVHEQRTGDVHVPVMLGVKEGVVNANAMQHGGYNIVNQLNKEFPVLARGRPNDQTTVAPTIMPPQTESPTVETMPSQTESPTTEAVPTQTIEDENELRRESFRQNLGKAIPYEILKPVKKDVEYLKLDEAKRVADATGNAPKAKALLQRLLGKEKTMVTQFVTSPAFRANYEAIAKGTSAFLERATDEELARYGFDRVLEARRANQKAKLERDKFEEEKKTGVETRALMQAQAKSFKYSALETEERLKYIKAQTAYEEARTANEKAKGVLGGLSSVDFMKNTTDIVEKTLSGLKATGADRAAELEGILKNEPVIRTAFDNYAKMQTGKADATYKVLVEPGWVEKLWKWFSKDTISNRGIPTTSPATSSDTNGLSPEALKLMNETGLTP